MAKLNVNQIRELAKQIIEQNPTGIRYKDLVHRISEPNPETSLNTIGGSVWDLETRFPNSVHKPSRGLYLPASVSEGEPPPPPLPTIIQKFKEEDFYSPFADWLRNELDEATVAIPLGGAGMQKKWGTPDIVGVYKPLASHRIKFDLEIIAAEIKNEYQQPIVAFGQAAAYRLFAAKSYVVMPNSIPPEDYSRLKMLCMLYGIGLVLFEPTPQQPDFEIRVRAQRFSPDMFYVNEFAERLYQLDATVFNQLFG